MYYEIFKILLIILFMEIIFIYILLNPPTDIKARLSIASQILVARLFVTSMIFVSLFGFYIFFYDSMNYFKKGGEYLKTTECVVQNVTTFPILSFMKKNIKCNDTRFINYFTFNSFYENEKFKFTYLPKSKIIVRSELLESPYDKRINQK